MTLFRVFASLSCIALVALPGRGQGVSPVTGISLGRMLATQLEQRVLLSSDQPLLALVDRVAQTLVRNANTEIPVVTRVIESSEVNVVTLPGHVYVTSALVRAAKDEAELAWALAYGIAPSMASSFLFEFELRTLLPDRNETFAVGPSSRMSLRGVPGLSQWILQGERQKRQAIEEADSLSLQYLFKAGYDPRAAISFLQKIEATSSARVTNKDSSGVFYVHPSLAQRIKKMESAIQKLPKRDDHLITTREFDDVHQRLVEAMR